MTAFEDRPVQHVPAREIPVPTSVSAEAQGMLAGGVIGGVEYPTPENVDAWRTMIAETAELVATMLGDSKTEGVDVGSIDLGEFSAFEVAATSNDPTDGRVYLDIHGGALINGSGELCRVMATRTAVNFEMRVLAPDYRMPPDHPYPTPLDDCLAAYRYLLRDHRPDEIVVGGGSAGANLAGALVLRARDEGLPMPACAVLSYPEVDLTESGDSFQTMVGVDNVGGGQSLMAVNLLYADGHDLAHPYLSPLFGDFTKGFPPTLLMSGTRDVFLSNTVRMHRALRAAGVTAELHVLEAAPHGGFMVDTPEERAMSADIRRFIAVHTSVGGPGGDA